MIARGQFVVLLTRPFSPGRSREFTPLQNPTHREANPTMNLLLSLCALLFVLFLSNVRSDGGSYGWNVSGITNQSVVTCLQRKNNAQFILFTGYSSNKFVANVCNELKFAQSAGIPHRDVLFVPCPTCSASAATQLSTMLSGLQTNCDSLWEHRVWLDMASYSLWPTPWREAGYVANQRWFEDLVDACASTKGITCGILSDPSDWKYTLGSTSYSYAPSLSFPLWYENLDGVASFAGFTPFGGFTKPYAKQFSYTVSVCGASVVWEGWTDGNFTM